MLVKMTKDGLIHINAETEIEVYALQNWCNENKDALMNSAILIECKID